MPLQATIIQCAQYQRYLNMTLHRTLAFRKTNLTAEQCAQIVNNV